MYAVSLTLTNSAWAEENTLHVLHGLPGPGHVESLDNIEDWKGHFSAVEVEDEAVHLAVDRMRSYPLFYTLRDGAICVTDDADVATSWAEGIDVEARVEFLAAGFVTGPRTIFSNIAQVEAGSVVSIDRKSGDISIQTWGLSMHEPVGSEISDEDEFDQELERTIRDAIVRVLEHTGDRRLVIPLSGGLDSRLLVAHLKLLGVENVTCFTYGRPGAVEMNYSREVAESAGFDWHAVDYTEETVKKIWDRPETAQWMRASWACSAMPHPQDYVALVDMLEKGIIPADSVILPGHTVVGNMHDEDILGQGGVDADFLKELILDHHFNLVPEVKKAPASARKVIDDLFEIINYDGSDRSVRDAVENYNLRERQAKYINNSARAYDFLGLGWSYPMIDTEVYRCWTRGSAELTVTRDMYGLHVERLYAQATGRAPELYEEHTVTVNAGVRSTVETFLKKTHLMPIASHAVRLWGYTHHTLGFNHFTREDRVERARRTLTLDPVLGRWCRSFLKDHWGPKHHLFDHLRK